MTFCYNEGRATEQADLRGGRLWCMTMFVHCGLWCMTVHCGLWYMTVCSLSGLWCMTVCSLWIVVYDCSLWTVVYDCLFTVDCGVRLFVHCGLWCMTVDCGV